MMRLYVEIGNNSRTVALTIENEAATVGELCTALGFDASRGLLADGRPLDSGMRLVDAPLVDGISIRPFGSDVSSAEHVAWVGVTAGPDTGSVHRLSGPSVVRIGRNPDSELPVHNDSISGAHAELTWAGGSGEIIDLGSRNGTWIGDRSITAATVIDEAEPIRVGSSEVQIRSVDTSDRPLGATADHASLAGRILMNRPPRPTLPAKPTPLQLPDPLTDRASPKFPLLRMIVPIIFAVVMVRVTGSLQFALFALLSPVMAIGTYVSRRKEVKGDRKTDAKTHADALTKLDEDLAAGIEQERLRRRHLGPDMVELRRRVEVPSSRLWERRTVSEDALTARVGRGTIPWKPPLAEASPGFDSVADDVGEIVDRYNTVSGIELLADLHLGVLGIHGDPLKARSLTRALALQVAINHGPADVRIAVLTTEERKSEWSWFMWLPHAASNDGGPPLVLSGDGARRLADSLLEQLPESSAYGKPSALLPRWLLLVDDVSLVHERASALRQILERGDAGIHGVVMADRLDQLPASTVQVLEVDGADGECSLGRVGDRRADGFGVADSVSIATATDIARAMSRFEDPEVELVGGGLPESVTIRDILCGPSAEEILSRWRVSSTENSLGAPLGIGPEGPVVIDMTVDGPHGLVAGTTGAGKSELLRTMVIGLASEHSPDDLVFVLVDYKGGSAFDVCTSLPHVVGIVTDLDEQLSQRALRSLDAELHHRELVLRDAAAKDIFEYRDLGSPAGPLPRLMVVIDEFATLRAELPDFVSALVGIAQRGRSLGVHLILATQRPSGAVDANIKANTNLRIALRVQDGSDSRDVIDVPAAAELPRTLPGRAYVRRGEGDLTPVQTGYASGPISTETGPRLRLTEVGKPSSEAKKQNAAGEVTNLAQYVQACVAAGESYETPRRPWVDPLPATVSQADVDHSTATVPADKGAIILAIGDDPDRQRRVPVSWDPTSGHLGVIGTLGSGVTTLVKSVVIGAGVFAGDRPTWVYACDHGAKGLVGLDAYPHVAPLLEADDLPRHERLLSMLDAMLEERKQAGAEAAELPIVIVAIDGIAGFTERNSIETGSTNGDRFARLVRDGPSVGIVFVVGAAAYKDLPRPFRGAFRTTFGLEQNDPGDYSHFGVRPKDVPTFVPGRAVVGEENTLAQVVDWSTLRAPETLVGLGAPPSIEPLPDLIDATELPAASVGSTLEIPIGIENETRDLAILRARSGEHITIAGPAESGRTSALKLIATQLRRGDPKLVLVGLAGPDSDLLDIGVFDAFGTFEELKDILSAAATDHRRWVVIVDDADRVEDESGPLHTMARNPPTNVTLIIAMRSASARGSYGHWTRFVRASGLGVVLQPDNSTDSDVLNVRLPRGERLKAVPGRGYLGQAGSAAECQMALVPATPDNS